MSVKQIIKEAMDRDPIALKEAVSAELLGRVGLALEAKKMKMEMDHMDDEDQTDDEEDGDDEDDDE